MQLKKKLKNNILSDIKKTVQISERFFCFTRTCKVKVPGNDYIYQDQLEDMLHVGCNTDNNLQDIFLPLMEPLLPEFVSGLFLIIFS
ncbi:hypothetical protein BAX96_16855 [Elizabethkingia anophelis]|nr:hypothetical protein [Elizabethkingia anophelis]MDV3476133.1 hypothetical protein [Elizabethkingia anophelis]MDV3590927.1 hypothetical protein [Elizabethkingia anophelis]MDV3675544.1 hypothetical protein [Elizabethkingia anophelis]MDV3683657.1 hypothetical protein [Elizabethkingia anophelis]